MIEYHEIPPKYEISNARFKELKEILTDEEARASFAEFCYNNLGLTVHILTGGSVRLFPFQEIILREWFNHNFNFNMWGRGVSKSYLVHVFCWLYPLFNKGTRIVLASNVFRSTRRIVKQIEDTINHKQSSLLKSCFKVRAGKLASRNADEWTLDLNEGVIVALPLNEKIRGQRADVLVGDEFLQIPEDIYRSVLFPMLASSNKVNEQLKMRELENAMISAGKKMAEEERQIIEDNKKIILLTSAPFDFQFCNKLYKDWKDKASNPQVPIETRRKYFVSRISFEAAPPGLISADVAIEAAAVGKDTAAYKREWMAIPSSSSDSYFNIKKLHENTVENGDLPCVQIKGNKESKYILSIDPSFSSSKASDLFGMTVHLLNDESRSITQVHSYGVAGRDLREHITYLHYLLRVFNIVFVVADLPGEKNSFIQAANESLMFAKSNIYLNFIEGDFNDEAGYLMELTKAKNSYNQSSKRICYRQIANADWNKKANEYLQTQIDRNKIKYASAICGHNDAFQHAIKDVESAGMPVEFKDKDGDIVDIGEFCSQQDEWIELTKTQIAMIEPKTTVNGIMQFDLPANLKRDNKNPTRARRDLYSCTVMAAWGAKCFWDFTYNAPSEQDQEMFTPILI